MAQFEQQSHVADMVRRNTMAAGIAALCLCYYGFMALAEPVGTDLHSQSNWLFYHTLRIGGVLMGVLAVWSLMGMVLALAVDGVVSIMIGVLFCLSGGGMLLDGGGGLNTILIIIFGMMFVGAGRRNLLTYRLLSAGGRVAADGGRVTMVAGVAPAPHPAPSTPTSTPTPAPPTMTAMTPLEEPAPQTLGEVAPETPPGGFLASMGKQPPPPNS